MKKIISLLGMAILFSCSKNEDSINDVMTEPSVYIVGSESNGTKQVAKLWKDGVSFALTDGTQDAYANSVFVSNSKDVYVVGNEYTPGQNDNGESFLATIWKNNQKITLPVDSEQFSVANDVFVTDNNDVYVVGSEHNGNYLVAKLWKNGVATNLTDGTSGAEAKAVYVSGNDVYVVGNKYENNTKIAKFWKNGVEISLTNGSDHAYATDVFVKGNDVHIVGQAIEGNWTAKYWKNGDEIIVGSTQNTNYSSAQSIFVDNDNNVYIAGREINAQGFTVAKYWKNNNEVLLTDGTTNEFINGVFVKDNDVYVIGEANHKSTLWKNGVATELTTGVRKFFNTAIFIK